MIELIFFSIISGLIGAAFGIKLGQHYTRKTTKEIEKLLDDVDYGHIRNHR